MPDESDEPLSVVIAELRAVPDSGWPKIEDPWRELHEIRYGPHEQQGESKMTMIEKWRWIPGSLSVRNADGHVIARTYVAPGVPISQAMKNACFLSFVPEWVAVSEEHGLPVISRAANMVAGGEFTTMLEADDGMFSVHCGSRSVEGLKSVDEVHAIVKLLDTFATK